MTSTVSEKLTSGLRSCSALSGTAARSSARTSFSEPLTARPIGVRTASTMTASGMCTPLIVPRRRTRGAVIPRRSHSTGVVTAFYDETRSKRRAAGELSAQRHPRARGARELSWHERSRLHRRRRRLDLPGRRGRLRLRGHLRVLHPHRVGDRLPPARPPLLELAG